MKYAKRTISSCTVAVVASGLAGCSVHPLPQDVSFVDTVEIVKRVRCEARAGLQAARDAVANNEKKKAHVERIIEGTTIGFEFSFLMSETNKAASGELRFKRDGAKKGESFELVVNANLNGERDEKDKTRQNKRVFRVLDDLKELKDTPCGRGTVAVGPNLVYPITGSTGMADVVRTYIELETLTDLAPGKDAKTVTFSDDLDFTTTFETAAALDVSLKTAVGSLRLSKVSVAGVAMREDVHSVKVVLARDPDHFDVDSPGRDKSRLGKTKGEKAKVKDVRGKGLQTFLAQRKETGRNRVFIELEKQRRVADDKAVAERVLGLKLP
jgi:hypothetical protein